MKPGDEVRFNMYIVNEGKYHKLDILYKVTDKEAEDQSGYTVVATRNAVVQVISSSTDYIVSGNQTVYTLTTATVNELIGTSSPELYCELADSITAKTGEKYAHYSDYLCDPAPGVWLGKQGQGHKWTGNSEAPVGICYAPSTGNFTIYQAPGANPVGSAYKTNLYLVNEETKDMVKVSFTIQFVSELVEINIVGEEDVTLPVDLNGQNVDIDLSKAATALEVTVDETRILDINVRKENGETGPVFMSAVTNLIPRIIFFVSRAMPFVAATLAKNIRIARPAQASAVPPAKIAPPRLPAF